MSFLSAIFTDLIRYCLILTDWNFGTALIVFTLFTRIILFPISFISHKNSIILLRIHPQLEDIKARFAGELSTILAEQKALYKKEKYSTLKALLPMILQIIIVLGVIGAVYSVFENNEYNFMFLGFDLSVIPTLNSYYIIIPILSAVSAFILCLVQNIFNPLAKMQGFMGKWGTAIFLTAFSGYFALVFESGIGFYWILGNILGSLITIICVLIYPPKNYADLSIIVRKTKPTKEEIAQKKQRKITEKARGKEDVARFYSVKKQLVFYSEASGFYKYFKPYIEYILKESDIVIHYVTSDINDQVFSINHERFKSYFCTPNGLITLFMKMDCDVFVMTMPDLEKYHYKRSLIRKDIEYIYTDHGFGSVNLLLRHGALDHFDTIFCGGISYVHEIRQMEEHSRKDEKKLVEVGFALFDELIAAYEKLEKSENKKPQILIAPSWQKDNILEYCLDGLMANLDSEKYNIIIRPHPEFVKRFPHKMRKIVDKYKEKVETDFSSNSTVYLSDVVITDWSSIAQEFSFTTKKPSLFINTPMKIMNPHWEIGYTPIDIWIRDEIGKSVEAENLSSISEVVASLIQNSQDYREKIETIFKENVFNIGDCARVGGEYLIGKIKGNQSNV